MGNDSLETVVARALRTATFPEDGEWFFEAFCDEEGTFVGRETELWDFKDNWPFSYSDDYFYGIVKHIISFANTNGGIIVFGVDDKSRKAIPSKIRPNLDKLNRSLVDLLKNPPNVDLRTYRVDSDRSVHVLFVRRNVPVCLPASFRAEQAERLRLARYWVRSGHETVFAQAKHIGLLFCGSDYEAGGVPTVDAALPPSPATIRQFVGRLETMERLFEWLHSSYENRAFLHGKGGSGKTTIAFEFAKHLSSNGRNVRFDNLDALDKVIFVSAKEKALTVESGVSQDFIGRDFDDEISLYRSIVLLSGESDRDPYYMERAELIHEMSLIFDRISILIIIDDIDTLTTKGINPGFDNLFRCAARAKRTTKILYTLRNLPTMALANSIEVPGLNKGREYQRFVEVCCSQFGVEEPEVALRDGRLAQVTERRPLVLESIIALRRNAGSYEKAISLFEENVGDDARQYVFQREWNALPNDNVARHLLATMALYGKPATIDDLVAMLRNSVEVVVAAVAATREMFLEVHEAGNESAFGLGSLTTSFVKAASKSLDKLGTIEARVNSFKKAFLPNFPELSRILTRNELHLRKAARYSNYESAAAAFADLDPARHVPKIAEDPRFRAMRGYAALLLKEVDLDQASGDLRFCLAMKFEPEIAYLQTWHKVAEESGRGSQYCDEIVAFVSQARGYSDEEKIDFQSRRASRLYRLALEERFLSPVDAVAKVREAGIIHAENFSRSTRRGYRNLLRYENYFRNTTLYLFMICKESSLSDDAVDYVADLSKLQSCVLDPISDGVLEYFDSMFLGATGKPARVHGRLKYLRGLIEPRTKWENGNVRDRVLEKIDSILDRLVPSSR